MFQRTIVITACLFSCLALNTYAQEASEIDRWLNDLASHHYQTREAATKQLGKTGPQHLEQLFFHLEDSHLAEVELRLFQVVQNILDNADDDDVDSIANAIKKAKNARSKNVREFAERFEFFIGHPETQQIVKQFRTLVIEGQKKVNDKEPNAKIISEETAKQLIDAKDFELVKQTRNSPGARNHVSTDPDKHQQILIYRIKWFKGGWSGWFVPGINDSDAKVKGDLMWRYFRDHESQYIRLRPKFGPYSRRQTFLPNKSQSANKTKSEPNHK